MAPIAFGSIVRSAACVLALVSPTIGYGDDTDIFMQQDKNAKLAVPLVMLSLDLRPNTISSNYCTLGGDCETKLGTEVHTKLKQINTDWGLGLSSVTMFDATRAVYATLFDKLDKVKVGMMVSHNESNQGGGSDGAYVLRGFRSFKISYNADGSVANTDPNNAKQELVRKLFSLPQPISRTTGSSTAASACAASISSDTTLSFTVAAASGSNNTVTVTASITNVQVYEDAGTANFTVTYTVSNNNGGNRATQTISIAAFDGGASGVESAVSGTNYSFSPTSIIIPAGTRGSTTRTVTASIINRPNDYDPQYDFKLRAYQTVNSDTAVGFGSICEPKPGFSVNSPSAVTEGSPVTFTVTRTGRITNSATVDFGTLDGTATVAGNDYVARPETAASSKTLSFCFPLSNRCTLADSTTQTVTVTTKADLDSSGPEDFYLRLSNASSGNVILTNTGTGTITEPSTCEPSNMTNASNAHPFQGAELYFEFFRYLTGGKLYQSRSGSADFTGSSSVKNLDQECYQPGLSTAKPSSLDPDGNVDAVLAWDRGGRPTSVTGGETDPVVDDGTNYITPFTSDSACTGTYMINTMFGVSNSSSASQRADMSASIGSGGTGQTISSSDDFPDMIRFLGTTGLAVNSYPTLQAAGLPSNTTQRVSSYVIRLDGAAGGQFTSIANAGATVIEVDTSAGIAGLLAKLQEIFRQIASVSTSFVSASVPVNVFNRVELSDDIFIALFNVDENLKPTWPGNVKKLKLATGASGTLIVRDALDARNSAIQNSGANAGRINFDALTYWTLENKLPCPIGKGLLCDLTQYPNDVSAGDEQSLKVPFRDGPFASRGGAGHRIPGFTGGNTSEPGIPGLQNSEGKRKLFTEPDDGGTTLLALDANDSTANTLKASFDSAFVSPGTTTQAEAKSLICYARGVSNCPLSPFSEPLPTTSDATARSWIMADALHSRPLPLNYGARTGFSATNQDIRVLVGTNDGYFRMIQNTAPGTSCGDVNDNGTIDAAEIACTEAGIENWAFMPRKVMPVVKEQMADSPMTSDLSKTSFYRSYGVDGEPVTIVNAGIDGVTIDSTAGDTAWVYFGLRRGGAGIYGLDVSDPDNPKRLWSITDQTPGFEELALTFSAPVPALVQYGSAKRQVLIFGGGYYGGWKDIKNNSTDAAGADGIPDTRVGYDSYDNTVAPDLSATKGKGNAIYIVDAQTGDLIWKAMDTGSAGTTPSGAVTYDKNAGLDHSIAARINVVDSNGDRISDRAYVGDMGGNIWRIDLPSKPPATTVTEAQQLAKWQITKLAALGDGGTTGSRDGGSDDRRFFNKVDVVFASDPNNSESTFDALLIGSGDREHPKVNTVENYFFVLKDPNGQTIPTSESPVDISSLADADCFLASGAPSSGCSSAASSLGTGWKLKMEQPGEKVLSSSLTIGSQVFFSTYLPQGGSTDSTSCTTVKLGTGRGYAVSLFNGNPVINRVLSDDNTTLPTTKLDRVDDTSWGQGIPTEYQSLGGNVVMGRPGSFQNVNISSYYKTFWFEKDIDN